MCRIYAAKCMKCPRLIQIHLADFKLEPEDVQVFCRRHLPKADVVIHTVSQGGRDDWPIRKGSRFGFRFLRALPVGYGWDDFCPNLFSQTQIQVIGNPVRAIP